MREGRKSMTPPLEMVEYTKELSYPAKLLYEIVTDYERYPQWLPEFKKATILKKEGNTVDVEFVFAVPVRKIRYRIHVVHNPEKLETNWTYLGGEVLEDTQGGWRFEPLGENRTKIHYKAGVSIQIPVSKGLVSRIANLITGTTIPRMFDNLEKEAKKRLSG
jgi:ribosome-associated toxin RatA of RatAB toxin-antitoxin module